MKKKNTPFYEPYNVPSTHLSVLHILTHSNLTTISVWKMKKLIESLSNLPMSNYNLSKCSKASRVASKSIFFSYTVCVCVCSHMCPHQHKSLHMANLEAEVRGDSCTGWRKRGEKEEWRKGEVTMLFKCIYY